MKKNECHGPTDRHAHVLSKERIISVGVDIIELMPPRHLQDYREAMTLANQEVGKHYVNSMLISWYDRDRDFESPQHSSECHLDSAIPGYIDYGISHGAKLLIDIEGGRFMFFYTPVDN